MFHLGPTISDQKNLNMLKQHQDKIAWVSILVLTYLHNLVTCIERMNRYPYLWLHKIQSHYMFSHYRQYIQLILRLLIPVTQPLEGRTVITSCWYLLSINPHMHLVDENVIYFQSIYHFVCGGSKSRTAVDLPFVMCWAFCDEITFLKWCHLYW